MDNATYDEVNLTPANTDETYSRLRTTQNQIKQNYELQRTADIDQSTMHNFKKASKFNTGMTCILMVVLLLLALVSIALLVTVFSHIISEQSNVLSQFENVNNNIKSALTQLDTTQLVMSQNNISQLLNQLDAQFSHFISQQYYSSLQTQINCGLGLWYRLIFLNMSDPSQECPPTWREYTDGVRACGRPVNGTGSCAAILHLTGQTYSRVCGRLIGYQYKTPDAFRQYNNMNDIDLDGINITRGAQHDHIWSYVAGHTRDRQSDCPCSSNNTSSPPRSISNRYYCESGSPSSNHLLWDSQQCEGTCRNGANSPPWFSVKLPSPTIDAIEVNICCDQRTNDEDVLVELIEIYVQ